MKSRILKPIEKGSPPEENSYQYSSQKILNIYPSLSLEDLTREPDFKTHASPQHDGTSSSPHSPSLLGGYLGLQRLVSEQFPKLEITIGPQTVSTSCFMRGLSEVMSSPKRKSPSLSLLSGLSVASNRQVRVSIIKDDEATQYYFPNYDESVSNSIDFFQVQEYGLWFLVDRERSGYPDYFLVPECPIDPYEFKRCDVCGYWRYIRQSCTANCTETSMIAENCCLDPPLFFIAVSFHCGLPLEEALRCCTDRTSPEPSCLFAMEKFVSEHLMLPTKNGTFQPFDITYLRVICDACGGPNTAVNLENVPVRIAESLQLLVISEKESKRILSQLYKKVFQNVSRKGQTHHKRLGDEIESNADVKEMLLQHFRALKDHIGKEIGLSDLILSEDSLSSVVGSDKLTQTTLTTTDSLRYYSERLLRTDYTTELLLLVHDKLEAALKRGHPLRVMFHGKSGVGKSTLLDLLLELSAPSMRLYHSNNEFAKERELEPEGVLEARNFDPRFSSTQLCQYPVSVVTDVYNACKSEEKTRLTDLKASTKAIPFLLPTCNPLGYTTALPIAAHFGRKYELLVEFHASLKDWNELPEDGWLKLTQEIRGREGDPIEDEDLADELQTLLKESNFQNTTVIDKWLADCNLKVGDFLGKSFVFTTEGVDCDQDRSIIRLLLNCLQGLARPEEQHLRKMSQEFKHPFFQMLATHGHVLGKRLRPFIRQMKVICPCSVLPIKGEILDSPGIGEIDPIRLALTKEELSNADHVVFFLQKPAENEVKALLDVFLGETHPISASDSETVRASWWNSCPKIWKKLCSQVEPLLLASDDRFEAELKSSFPGPSSLQFSFLIKDENVDTDKAPDAQRNLRLIETLRKVFAKELFQCLRRFIVMMPEVNAKYKSEQRSLISKRINTVAMEIAAVTPVQLVATRAFMHLLLSPNNPTETLELTKLPQFGDDWFQVIEFLGRLEMLAQKWICSALEKKLLEALKDLMQETQQLISSLSSDSIDQNSLNLWKRLEKQENWKSLSQEVLDTSKPPFGSFFKLLLSLKQEITLELAELYNTSSKDVDKRFHVMIQALIRILVSKKLSGKFATEFLQTFRSLSESGEISKEHKNSYEKKIKSAIDRAIRTNEFLKAKRRTLSEFRRHVQDTELWSVRGEPDIVERIMDEFFPSDFTLHLSSNVENPSFAEALMRFLVGPRFQDEKKRKIPAVYQVRGFNRPPTESVAARENLRNFSSILQGLSAKLKEPKEQVERNFKTICSSIDDPSEIARMYGRIAFGGCLSRGMKAEILQSTLASTVDSPSLQFSEDYSEPVEEALDEMIWENINFPSLIRPFLASVNLYSGSGLAQVFQEEVHSTGPFKSLALHDLIEAQNTREKPFSEWVLTLHHSSKGKRFTQIFEKFFSENQADHQVDVQSKKTLPEAIARVLYGSEENGKTYKLRLDLLMKKLARAEERSSAGFFLTCEKLLQYVAMAERVRFALVSIDSNKAEVCTVGQRLASHPLPPSQDTPYVLLFTPHAMKDKDNFVEWKRANQRSWGLIEVGESRRFENSEKRLRESSDAGDVLPPLKRGVNDIDFVANQGWEDDALIVDVPSQPPLKDEASKMEVDTAAAENFSFQIPPGSKAGDLKMEKIDLKMEKIDDLKPLKKELASESMAVEQSPDLVPPVRRQGSTLRSFLSKCKNPASSDPTATGTKLEPESTEIQKARMRMQEAQAIEALGVRSVKFELDIHGVSSYLAFLTPDNAIELKSRKDLSQVLRLTMDQFLTIRREYFLFTQGASYVRGSPAKIQRVDRKRQETPLLHEQICGDDRVFIDPGVFAVCDGVTGQTEYDSTGRLVQSQERSDPSVTSYSFTSALKYLRHGHLDKGRGVLDLFKEVHIQAFRVGRPLLLYSTVDHSTRHQGDRPALTNWRLKLRSLCENLSFNRALSADLNPLWTQLSSGLRDSSTPMMCKSSTTILLGKLRGKKLDFIVLGDSSVAILRRNEHGNYKIVKDSLFSTVFARSSTGSRAPSQWGISSTLFKNIEVRDWTYPHNIGWCRFEEDLQEGDIIIAGSDGLWSQQDPNFAEYSLLKKVNLKDYPGRAPDFHRVKMMAEISDKFQRIVDRMDSTHPSFAKQLTKRIRDEFILPFHRLKNRADDTSLVVLVVGHIPLITERSHEYRALDSYKAQNVTSSPHPLPKDEEFQVFSLPPDAMKRRS